MKNTSASSHSERERVCNSACSRWEPRSTVSLVACSRTNVDRNCCFKKHLDLAERVAGAGLWADCRADFFDGLRIVVTAINSLAVTGSSAAAWPALPSSSAGAPRPQIHPTPALASNVAGSGLDAATSQVYLHQIVRPIHDHRHTLHVRSRAVLSPRFHGTSLLIPKRGLP